MSAKIKPVIWQAVSDRWDELASIVQRHYDIAPGRSSKIQIRGTMDEVYHSMIAKLFLIPGRLLGALVPYKGKQIPTQVINWTLAENNKAMFWHRTLEFPGKPPLIFASHMEYVGDNEIIEYVRYGVGIRMAMSVEQGALVFKSKGYVWKLGKRMIPIPAWLILGDATIIEKAETDEQFYINFTMTHPLFGKTFSYSGRFYIVEAIL